MQVTKFMENSYSSAEGKICSAKASTRKEERSPHFNNQGRKSKTSPKQTEGRKS